MKKRIIALSILLVLLLSYTVYAANEWDTFVSKDEMEGTETWYATSPEVTTTEKMDFPYTGTKASLIVGYDGEDEWGYVAFSNAPNLSDTETEDGYNVIYTRVKFDDKIKNTTLTQDWGSKFLNFRNDKGIISKIKSSNTLLLELNWHGEGEVYFRFPLDGSADAINKIHDKFNN
ncbi:hypothetical protein [Sporohalobacter salinus]|uniref:hypothetical protein n=1 Tax=Sporohalobacter salinus TaxID=1494606 RepID=UPI00195F4168|nr:hypothetical protein [Sporohalobacter salinus]MBM7624749.1 hypothetical protein [Sporohalobacter salinus]